MQRRRASGALAATPAHSHGWYIFNSPVGGLPLDRPKIERRPAVASNVRMFHPRSCVLYSATTGCLGKGFFRVNGLLVGSGKQNAPRAAASSPRHVVLVTTEWLGAATRRRRRRSKASLSASTCLRRTRRGRVRAFGRPLDNEDQIQPRVPHLFSARRLDRVGRRRRSGASGPSRRGTGSPSKRSLRQSRSRRTCHQRELPEHS